MQEEAKFIGVDIGGTKCSVVLGDASANIIKKVKIKTTAFLDTLENLQDIIEKMMTAEVKAIGVVCGGPLDSKKGLILSPPNLPGWDEVPIVEILQNRFGVPTFLWNDANACAVAEWKYGAGQGYDNVVFLTFGTGMGAGLILNGRPYFGSCDMAGEIGHVKIYRSGHIGYGKAGSFEGYCSGNGIAQYGLGSAKELSDEAFAGDKKALRIFSKVGKDLASGLSILIDILNPDIIILGGVYMRSEPLIEPSMRKKLLEETIPQSLETVRVVPAKLGEYLGDVSALCVAQQEYK